MTNSTFLLFSCVYTRVVTISWLNYWAWPKNLHNLLGFKFDFSQLIMNPKKCSKETASLALFGGSSAFQPKINKSSPYITILTPCFLSQFTIGLPNLVKIKGVEVNPKGRTLNWYSWLSVIGSLLLKDDSSFYDIDFIGISSMWYVTISFSGSPWCCGPCVFKKKSRDIEI